MFWKNPQPDPLRPIVLANLERLQRLFHARGRRFEFNPTLTTEALERGLWRAVSETAEGLSLSFPPSMACEQRISEIIRNLPPLARQGQWPGWLQTAR